jgi:3',5'-cyclic AMP phosphodiesterase CpdA
VLPPLARAVTTAERQLIPSAPQQDGSGPNPADPEAADAYLADDLGALDRLPGLPPVVRTLDGTIPGPGRDARRLARFVFLADLQLMDDESPARTGVADSVPATSGALRPQDPELCRMTHATVRAINALHRDDPIDFVLLGGDNADSAQQNEVRWVMSILNGGLVHCDSGDDDDLDPGGEDGKDPFVSEGLAMPWRWVSGNHDVTVQGNFPVDDEQRGRALGNASDLGTRDDSFRRRGAVRTGDFVIPDPARAPLDGPGLLALVGDDGDDHGLGDVDRTHGKAFYSFDVGDALRFVVLDTTSVAGGADGVLSRADVERFVRPALEGARAEGRAVVLAAHHATATFTIDGGVFGRVVDDALLPDEWLAWLDEFDDVAFALVAHTHVHQVRELRTPDGGGFWEVMTASIADWPHQFRIFELWDDDNGKLRLTAIPVDFAVDDDAVAARGRTLGVIDQVAGFTFVTTAPTPGDLNVSLLWPRPAR